MLSRRTSTGIIQRRGRVVRLENPITTVVIVPKMTQIQTFRVDVNAKVYANIVNTRKNATKLC